MRARVEKVYVLVWNKSKTELYQLLKMMSFNYNSLGQRTIINNIMILTKRGADRMNTVILEKYQKYPSTTILKHVNVLAKLNKFPYSSLLNMMPDDAYVFTIHVLTMNLVDISHKQNENHNNSIMEKPLCAI